MCGRRRMEIRDPCRMHVTFTHVDKRRRDVWTRQVGREGEGGASAGGWIHLHAVRLVWARLSLRRFRVSGESGVPQPADPGLAVLSYGTRVRASLLAYPGTVRPGGRW